MFDLTPQRAEDLHQSGRRAATDFLDRWNFDAYIREFREGKEHSRRDEVAQTLKRAAAGATMS